MKKQIFQYKLKHKHTTKYGSPHLYSFPLTLPPPQKKTLTAIN